MEKEIRRIDIYFHRNGGIDIMANVSRALGIQPGDVLDVYYDKDTKELYLYIRLRASTIHNPDARFRNAVRPSKRGSNNMRLQSKSITDFVNRLSGGVESWLYVGSLRKVDALACDALPLVYLNNKYINRNE